MSSASALYAALSDATRREILELLRDRGPLAAGAIAGHFADVSRPGISRHLRVLRECGLVSAEARGREQRYALDARPLQRARDGWLARFAGADVRSLRALRRRVEGPKRSRPRGPSA